MLASSPINSSPTLGPVGNLASTTKYLAKQDREALFQFTKHFVRKTVQIIVQSRLGDKKPTKSRVYAYNADWFNLNIKDLTQITNMTKQSLGNVEAIFTDNTPYCVEISLRTPENQTMILETWCILFNEQLADPSQKVCYSVYKKMSLVLRSLICLTRSIPTYQLSRRQNPDTYVLLYRMYCGEPIVHHLGENYGTAKVGTVGTPIGSLIVNVAYRTRLTMTPQNSSHATEYGAGGIHIKDDHFGSTAANTSTSTSSVTSQTPQRGATGGWTPGGGVGGGGNNYNNYSNKPSASASSPDLNPPTYDDMMGNYSPPLPDMRSPRPAFGADQSGNAMMIGSPNPGGPRRSTSNLNTIAETSITNTPETPTRVKNRATSKTQPIPMKSSQSQPSGISSGTTAASSSASQAVAIVGGTPRTNPASVGKNLQLQRYPMGGGGGGGGGNEVTALNQQADETSSADEYSSSVGSTSDTIYYFKLKSAAFVPAAASASFSASNSNPYINNYSSSSFGGNDMNELPPFIALLSNDFGNLSTTGGGHDSQLAIAQSPPPPNTHLIDYNIHQQQQQQQQLRLRNPSNVTGASPSVSSQDDRIASPCSLPNFKMLDHPPFLHSPHAVAAHAGASAAGLNQLEPDDFVFIESKKIAFGLSNAADDLRNFFRACENAPMLDSFHNEPLFNDVLKDLDQQLLSYESKVAEFDDLVKSLENN